jgi:hypothetical protein
MYNYNLEEVVSSDEVNLIQEETRKIHDKSVLIKKIIIRKDKKLKEIGMKEA